MYTFCRSPAQVLTPSRSGVADLVIHLARLVVQGVCSYNELINSLDMLHKLALPGNNAQILSLLAQVSITGDVHNTAEARFRDDKS